MRGDIDNENYNHEPITTKFPALDLVVSGIQGRMQVKVKSLLQ